MQPQLLAKTVLDDLVIKLFNHGISVCLVIFGRRETGKTDFSLLIAEVLKKHGILRYFASNIKIDSSPFLIEHITNLQDLESWASRVESTGELSKKLFILDEAGKSLRRRTPMAKLNIELLDKLQTLRKYKLSLIMIAPADKYIDSASMGSDVLDAIIVKPEFKNPKVALWHDILDDQELWLEEIPKTNVKFDTWDIAPFVLRATSIRPVFKDRELGLLWDFGHGKTVKELGVHPMEMNRIVRRFVKEALERDSHASQYKALEDIGSGSVVT